MKPEFLTLLYITYKEADGKRGVELMCVFFVWVGVG